MTYTGATYTKASDMYKCYELARLLNANMTEADYRAVIDKMTVSTNYTQHVILHDGKPIAFCATHDNLNMHAAPKLSCKLDNLATLPEYRGFVTKYLLDHVKRSFEEKGYDNLNLSVFIDNNRAKRFYEKQGFQNKSETWTFKIGQSKGVSRL